MIDLLLHHGLVITLDDERRVLEDHGIAIDKGRIIEIADSAALMEKHRAKRCMDCHGKIVMPGLIDCRVEVTPTWGGQPDEKTAGAYGRLCALKAVMGGVTTILAHRGAASAAAAASFAAACRQLGLNLVAGALPMAPVSGAGMAHGRVCVPVGEAGLPDGIAIGEDTLLLVEENAVLSFDTLAAIRDSGAPVCFTAARGHRRNAVGEMIASGVPVSITPRADQPGLLEAARNQAFLEDLFHDDERYLQAGKLLELLTVDAARCLGLQAETGAVAEGMRADLIVADRHTLRMAPACIPVQRVAYYATGADFETVIIAGKPVVENRVLQTGDAGGIMQQSGEIFPVRQILNDEAIS